MSIDQKERELIAKMGERTANYHARRDPVQNRAKAMKMLELHIDGGLSYTKIGEKYGVTRQRVQQLIHSLTHSK